MRTNPKFSYYRGQKISVDIINVGHINFVVEVEITWVQDPESSPKSL